MEPQQPLPPDREPTAAPDDDLQFDRAESAHPDSSSVACVACHNPVAGYYYQANGQTICVPCREGLAAAMAKGSSFFRFIKASVFGLLASVLGGLLYYGVIELTGYELGLIAIVLGLMVGVAVRFGSEARGGWFYQLIALGLTYLAISFMFVPSAYSGIKEGIVERNQAAATQPAAATAAEDAAEDAAAKLHMSVDQFTFKENAFIAGISILFCLMWPLAAKSMGTMGLIIKAIAFWEAWKINKKREIVVDGPFVVGTQAAGIHGIGARLMGENPSIGDLASCPACGTQWGPGLLACPGCSRLVHSESLKRLSELAAHVTAQGDLSTALQHWRTALELLPPSSRQHAIIAGRIEQLSRQVASTQPATATAGTAPATHDASRSIGGVNWKGIAGIGAFVVFLLSKAKFLVLGLGKATTFFSMLASFGLYWTEWGWRFGLGLVVSIYVHEMGHVAALRRCGLPASAPMFIPGFGALVRLKQSPASPREDAFIGLAGPVWGTAGALITFGLGLAMHWPAWLAIAHVAAWINLFNLLPIWQLDGSRGLRALNRPCRMLLLVVILVTWHFTGEGLLLLILLIAAFRTFGEKAPSEPDYSATLQFCGLVAVLSALCVQAVR